MSDKKNLKPLVRRAMKGDAAAFEKLVEGFSADIALSVSTQLDSRSDVQDVAQEVVLALYKNIAKLKSPNAFYAYLHRVITNKCITHNQKHNTLHQAEDIDEYVNEFEAEKSEQPQARLEQAALTEQVKQAIDRLPIKQREALYLYYYNDLSYKEIARIQRTSTNTVGVNISKAKAALEKMVEMQDAGDIYTHQGTSLDTVAKTGTAPDNNHTTKKRGIGGVITTPVLVDAVHRSVEEFAPQATLDSLRVYTHNLILENGGMLAGGAIGLFASASQQVVVAAVSITLAVGGLGAIGAQAVNAAIPVSKPVIEYTDFIPEARIEFSSSNHPPNINPVSAQAITNAGTIGAWSVVDQSGNSVLTGQGNATGEVLARLPKGAYTIHWHITNSTTEQSDPATMHRDFTVK